VDLVVIGSGPGGYVASIKAAQLGMKVCNKAVLSSAYKEESPQVWQQAKIVQLNKI